MRAWQSAVNGFFYLSSETGFLRVLIDSFGFCLQRRNRPNLNIGDLVYARVAVASRDMEPELACTDAAGKVYSCVMGNFTSCRSSSSQILAVSRRSGQ